MQPSIPEFQKQIAVARSADAVWSTLMALSGQQPGHLLFTVMTVDLAAGLARRAFSSHPVQYPVSGTKPIHHDVWFDIVHKERRSFVANTIEDIAKVFPDYELIGSLGCGSVLNLPLVVQGELVATVNMLHATHHYNSSRVKAAEELLTIPATLCWALAMQFDRGAPIPP